MTGTPELRQVHRPCPGSYYDCGVALCVAAQAAVSCSPTSYPCLLPHYLDDRRLQEDPSSGVDRSETLERMAREQPPVLSMKRLRKVSDFENSFASEKDAD